MRDRDRYENKHKTPAKGVDTGHGVPDFVGEDITKQYANDPATLKQMRSRRSTGERLAHLEEKYDRLVHKALESRTKIIVALIGLGTGVIGFLLGSGCQ